MGFRQVMGVFPTGVTIVAATGLSGQPLGLTVNSFTSVSLDPPLVLVCIDRASSSHDRLLDAGAFAINILSADQADFAVRFASDPSEGRFEGIEWRPSPSGSPVLAGVSGWLDCTIECVHDAGDHSIIVARVEGGDFSTRPALVFHRGTFGAAAS
jgi:flavin reductase (DIM6/NTAB) family NADH-FMN oxidoreductase RutF